MRQACPGVLPNCVRLTVRGRQVPPAGLPGCPRLETLVLYACSLALAAGPAAPAARLKQLALHGAAVLPAQVKLLGECVALERLVLGAAAASRTCGARQRVPVAALGHELVL